MTRAFSPGLDALTLLLADAPEQPHLNINFLFPSDTAVIRILDASPHEEQTTSPTHLERLSDLLDTYANFSVTLQWLPKKIPFIGFKRARQFAFEAICTADLTHLPEPHTIKRQKEATKRVAISAWTNRWQSAPRTSFAYRTALRKPPDGNLHPTLCLLATSLPPHTTQTGPVGPLRSTPNPTERNKTQDKVKFSRLTHSHTLPFYHRSRFYRGIHPTVFPLPHARTSGLPMRRANPNNRAHAPQLPTLHCRVPKASHGQWPHPYAPAALLPTEAHSSAAPFLGGDWCLR